MEYCRNILVTGATGFIGSHLVEELIINKSKVLSLDISDDQKRYFFLNKLHRKSRFIKADVCNFGKIKKIINTFKPDFIFHLAAQTIVETAYFNPLETLETNILGTANILEAARNYPKIKGIIIASSDKAYGKILYSCHSDQSASWRNVEESRSLPALPLASARDPSTEFIPSEVEGLGMTHSAKYLETDPLAGDHPYEVSKSACDLISHTYYKTYNLPVVVTRFGNVYGEGDLNFSRIVPGIMKTLVKKETLDIRSNGKFVRNYIYVKDVVGGYLLLADNIGKIKGEAFNFGSNEDYSVLELIKLTEKILKKKINYKILNIAKNEIPYQSVNYSKIQKRLGWKPRYSISKAIKQTFQWYKKSDLTPL